MTDEEILRALKTTKGPDGVPLIEWLEVPNKGDAENWGIPTTEMFFITDIRGDIYDDFHVKLIRALQAALSLPVSNIDIDRTSEPKGHWEDGGKVWVEDHVCCLPVSNTGEWQPIETAPKDGTHCILAVKEDEFVYAVQGAFYGGHWNAVHRANVEPLCWMPNVRVPKEFLPWEKSE